MLYHDNARVKEEGKVEAGAIPNKHKLDFK